MAYAKDANYAYTIRDWVESINDVGSPGGNFAAEYEYASKNGNITKATFNNPDIEVGGIPNDYWYDFSYDGLNRLTEADYDYPGFDDSGAHDFDVRGLAYDRAGNIDNLQRWDDSGSLIDDLTYSYSGNQLQSLTDAVSTTSDSWDAETVNNFDYDANGNLTSQSGKFTEITYDHRNLPTQFALGTGDTVIANYNADGQRILKELAGGSWQFYVKDGQQTLAVIKDSSLSHMNLIGNQTFGRIDADTSGAINNSNARRYYITDHLGSTRAVVDNSGNVLETFDYYPFGLLMPQRNGGTNTTLEKFTGKERDNEGGLNLDYFGARYYDPALGRWNSPDPLDEYESPYIYVGNNPLSFNDPTGMLSENVHQGLMVRTGGAGEIIVEEGDTYQDVLDYLNGDEVMAQRVWRKAFWSGDIDATGVALEDVSVLDTPAYLTATGFNPVDLMLLNPTKITINIFQKSFGKAKALSPKLTQKLHHLFGNPDHNFPQLLKAFDGDELKAFKAIKSATEEAVKNKYVNGEIFEEVAVDVAGKEVTVTGRIVDNNVEIGTAYIVE